MLSRAEQRHSEAALGLWCRKPAGCAPSCGPIVWTEAACLPRRSSFLPPAAQQRHTRPDRLGCRRSRLPWPSLRSHRGRALREGGSWRASRLGREVATLTFDLLLQPLAAGQRLLQLLDSLLLHRVGGTCQSRPARGRRGGATRGRSRLALPYRHWPTPATPAPSSSAAPPALTRKDRGSARCVTAKTVRAKRQLRIS